MASPYVVLHPQFANTRAGVWILSSVSSAAMRFTSSVISKALSAASASVPRVRDRLRLFSIYWALFTARSIRRSTSPTLWSRTVRSGGQQFGQRAFQVVRSGHFSKPGFKVTHGSFPRRSASENSGFAEARLPRPCASRRANPWSRLQYHPAAAYRPVAGDPESPGRATVRYWGPAIARTYAHRGNVPALALLPA